MVEGIGPAQHLAEHAVLQHRSRRRRHTAGFRRTVDLPRARPEVRRHAARRAPPLRATLHPRPAGPRLVHRRRRHRQLDRGPLRRLARSACRHHGVARRRVQPAALLLSFRSSVLLTAARLCSGAGHRLHSGVLVGRARLAIAVQNAGLARCPRARPSHLSPGRRPGIALPAWRRRRPAARPRPQVLPGPLRDGLQRARQLPGRHRLRRSEHRASAAVAGHRRLHRRRRVRLDGPLVPRRPAWRWPW